VTHQLDWGLVALAAPIWSALTPFSHLHLSHHHYYYYYHPHTSLLRDRPFRQG
jgi:hypothetical protein